MWRIWGCVHRKTECAYALCIRYCWACIEGLTASSCACVCRCVFSVWIWVLSITLQGNLSPWRALCVVKEQKKASPLPSSHLDSSSKRPSQSSHPGATGMGRNSSMTVRIHRQHQPRHPLKKKKEKKTGVGGNLMAGARDSSNVAVCTGLKIPWVFLGMLPDVFKLIRHSLHFLFI